MKSLKESIRSFISSLGRKANLQQARQLTEYYNQVFKTNKPLPEKACMSCIKHYRTQLSKWAESEETNFEKIKKLGKFVGVPLYEATKKTKEERKKICDSCTHFGGIICNVCGCIIINKVKDQEEECPMKKW